MMLISMQAWPSVTPRSTHSCPQHVIVGSFNHRLAFPTALGFHIERSAVLLLARLSEMMVLIGPSLHPSCASIGTLVAGRHIKHSLGDLTNVLVKLHRV